MSDYNQEWTLHYMNMLWSTTRTAFSPVSLQKMAIKNDNAAHMLLFFHYLKTEKGSVINAAKAVVDYIGEENKDSIISYNRNKITPSPATLFTPVSDEKDVSSDEEKISHFDEEDFPTLSESSKNSKVTKSVVEEEDSVVEDIPVITGVADREVRNFENIKVVAGKTPQQGKNYYKFFIEEYESQNAIYLSDDLIPSDMEIKRGSVFNITGKFRYSEGYKNWLLCGDFFISKIRLKGVQETDLTGKSQKIITSHRGETFFVSNTEIMNNDGPCSFELYKNNSRNSYCACNITKL